jgi:hypothetical protein
MMNEDEKPEAPAETPSEPPKASWERRETFALNDRMREVISKTAEAVNAEIASLQRKIDKLTYGG